MLVLTTVRPENPLAILSGAGLSCDAYHPTAPHPEGKGAFAAMSDALADAGIEPSAVDYINLHGTGTPDNDLAETRAIQALFPSVPPFSSIKGATGHSLAAAGAIEAVVAGLAVAKGFIPGNTGCQNPDPALGVTPQLEPLARPVQVVLSNSLGFGGNNGSLVITRSDASMPAGEVSSRGPLAVHGCACLTGIGMTESTLAGLRTGASVAGMAAATEFGGNLPPRLIRRVKRLARMSLALASCAHENASEGDKPSAVYMGTGWGALSETYDFLDGLSASSEQFPRPIDFVGSVHNGPAGQIALFFGATGANITASGGDYSFEQALFAAGSLLEDGQSALLMGADEAHERLSPLLDPSIEAKSVLADGGGALYVNRNPVNARCLVRLPFYARAIGGDSIDSLVAALGGAQAMQWDYAVILAGIPAGQDDQGRRQLLDLTDRIGSQVPILHYRDFVGEFASASAVAAVLAVAFLDAGFVPGVLAGGEDIPIQEKGKILVLGTGPFLTAMEFFRP
jgi:3-oxoacyl-(acyl-carrier-protein) synthase